ncbi:MAG: HAD family phosphatase [Alphaproteobacteria bacterium]|nr:HAD family phosphatase [Alphaproteobacteria bacterium]
MAALVIFDCDGVLLDTEAIGCAVFAETLQASGFDIDARALRAFIGVSTRNTYATLEARFARPIPETTRGQARAAFHSALRDLKPMPGLPAVLDALTVPVTSVPYFMGCAVGTAPQKTLPRRPDMNSIKIALAAALAMTTIAPAFAATVPANFAAGVVTAVDTTMGTVTVDGVIFASKATTLNDIGTGNEVDVAYVTVDGVKQALAVVLLGADEVQPIE